MAKIVHQIAECLDCGMIWQEHKGGKAQKQGYSHAKATGHKVIWETGTGGIYHFPKDLTPKQ